MIQGTMSNSGKSFLTAGLCRIFRRAGYRAAPFKSQNMALNSYITADGLEMGRAQVMQAEAAGIEPDVRMNPILLKPTNDTGSQVIVNGEVRGTMSARDYFKHKRALIPDIMSAYSSLAAENDIIVIEGAGSPAEINLKTDDIVNMGMARLAKAPVLLTGDIDRGGVFAQLIGTLILLDDIERDYIKGLFINKFRGDKTILDSGIDMLEEKSKKPVIGVIPYMHVSIDDEDSLTERFGARKVGAVDIAVVRLPRISNFTDFTVFDAIDGAGVRYAENPAELDGADVIIIPGTKDTIGDMLWLRESGMEAAIKKHASRGGIVIGICGGYQILGERITDSGGSEHRGSVRGMELLPIITEFESEKTRTRVSGTITGADGILSALNGLRIDGYEIHMGKSRITGDSAPMCIVHENGDTKPDGVSRGNIYGTYIHGFFDNTKIPAAIISAVMKSKGLSADSISEVDMSAYKQGQYDILADAVEANTDMDAVYRILEEGIK